MSSCYLIARMNDISYAVRTEWGKELASLVDYLSRKTSDTEIEILTVSSIKEWYEYGPYKLLASEKALIYQVLDEVERINGFSEGTSDLG